ncbi:MAG: prepilin-type N-terminal cleavage/methylation domain-containing protein [Candidatus Omnitrophota bacterium]
MKRRWSGFTLIELIIVIVIIGILALVALPRYFANIENARKAEALSTMRSYREAELAYYAKNGAYVAVAASGALRVDIDGDGVADISVDANSSNFTFAATTAGVITATHTATGGTVNYYMCVESGKAGTGTASCP